MENVKTYKHARVSYIKHLQMTRVSKTTFKISYKKQRLNLKVLLASEWLHMLLPMTDNM